MSIYLFNLLCDYFGQNIMSEFPVETDFDATSEVNIIRFLESAKRENVSIPAGLFVSLARNDYDGRKTGGYFSAPASTKFHGAYPGGLYDHSECVTERLLDLTQKNGLVWKRPQSPFIIGKYHDVCKVNSYYLLPDGSYAWNDLATDKRHAEKSLAIIEAAFELTDEERDCILFHMGPYAPKNASWEVISKLYADYDAAIRRHPNVMWTHMADMLASKLDNT